MLLPKPVGEVVDCTVIAHQCQHVLSTTDMGRHIGRECGIMIEGLVLLSNIIYLKCPNNGVKQGVVLFF
jgi:hypothetical protein